MSKEMTLLWILFALVIGTQVALLILCKLVFDEICRVSDKQICTKDLTNLYDTLHKPPKIITKTIDLVPIVADYEVPCWAEEQVSEDEIKSLLAQEIAREIPKYMEVQSDKDIRRLVTLYRARIMVGRK